MEMEFAYHNILLILVLHGPNNAEIVSWADSRSVGIHGSACYLTKWPLKLFSLIYLSR